MLISEDSARASQHADDREMPTIVLSPDGRQPLNPDESRRGFFPMSESVRQVFRDKDSAMATSEARAEELLQFQEERLSWRVYRVACQFRFGYLSFLVLMILLMFSFTLLMEIFFAIFLPSARTFSTEYVVRSVIMLALLPVILFFLSYFYEEATRFFFDAINKHDGGLPNFRLALSVVIHYVRNRSTYKATEAREEAASSHNSEVGSPRRSTVFISAKDDPFNEGEDEEEKSEAVEEVREWVQAREQAGAPITSKETSPAQRRWKRVGAAVRAANAIKHTQFEGPPITLSTFLLVDFVCPVLFEVFTIITCLLDFLGTWSPYSAFLTYVQNGFWLMGFYVIVWMGCHFWSSRNPHMRRLVSHHRRRRRIFRREVRNVANEKQAEQLWLLDVGFRFYHHVGVFLNPLAWVRRRREAATTRTKNPATGQADIDRTIVHSVDSRDEVAVDVNEPAPPTGFAAHVAKRVENLRHTRAAIRSKNPWYRLSLNAQAWILLGVCIAAALVSLWSFYVGWPIMGIGLIMLSTVIQRRFPQIFGRTFRHFITAFVVMSLLFFSATLIIGTFVTGGNFKLGTPTNATLTRAEVESEKLPMSVSKTIEYPVCSIDYNGLTVLDFALIADAAYGSTPEIQQSSLANRFNGTELQNWTMVAHNDESEHQVWMELFFPSLNTTVLAVRGTASAADALEDLHFWFGITIMQVVNVFIPFLKQLPRDFVVSLLSMRFFKSKIMPPPVYESMLNHAYEVKARVGDRLIITGHSLGGAMAAVLGARVKAQVVSLSGPGLLYSRGRFDVEAQDVRDYVLTLKPERDIVPQVDQLGGMVQELRCRHKSPMSCHSTYTHMCELYLSCGDSRERNWAVNEECNTYYKLPVPQTTD